MMQITKKKQVSKKKPTKGNRRVSIDIVTGMEVVSVYFDPEESIDFDASDDVSVGKHLYETASIVKDDGTVMSVKLLNGDVYKVHSKSAVKITEQDDQGVDDILALREFSEKSLIHTLRSRYSRDDIYTFVGPILLSINPYKWFKDLYTETTMTEYHDKKQGDLPPHLFVLADAAYTSLMQSSSNPKAKDQSIIISGESGAGKTEATKVIMAYLAKITAGDLLGDLSPSKIALDNVLVGELEQKVLNTNPMLEAFGNARTLRNDNSSRFGKFIKIQFSKAGRIVGATIEKYLLEKTRIVHQMEGERNFHIFYQLLRGATPELKAKMELSDNVSDYHYISDGESVIPSISDEEEFKTTCECMESIGIDKDMRVEVFTAISGILQLGNIAFESEQADYEVGNVAKEREGAFQSAARLLGLMPEELLTAITKQNMHVGGAVIVKQQSHLQAVEKRDSLSRCIYSMLFSWLVDKINSSISARDDSKWGFIGVLDIYGFENFHSNGFEQLLINYANEKLQNHFNKHIFQLEQAEYESESIDWSYVHFYDNQQCVDLVDGKPNGKSGVFQTLDDASASGRLDVNSSFLAQLNQTWSGSAGSLTTKHPNYVFPRFNSDSIFGVLHYAGEVQYNIASFAEKNRDSTNLDMRELLAKSRNKLLRDVMESSPYTEGQSSKDTVGQGAPMQVTASSKKAKKPTAAGAPARTGHVSKLKEDSISKQFSASLRLLCETLDLTDPHFVRCMKPNSAKLPNALNVLELRTQLRNAGMMETIRIRQQGYAFRQPHKEFFKRYLPLEPSCRTLQNLVDRLSNMLNVHDESWQVGTTKLFIKRLMSEKLDRLLWVRYASSSRRIQRAWGRLRRRIAVVNIQKNIRRFLALKKLKKVLKSVLTIQKIVRGRRMAVLYRKKMKSVLCIQCMLRGKAARLRARRLVNPHNRMGYVALTEALARTEEELELAFQMKKFSVCDSLQETIRDIQFARSKLPLPEITPTSRKELDLMLLEAKYTLDHTVTVHDLVLCGKLELRIQQLESYKSTYLTVEERQVSLKVAVDALDDAMTRKEFKKCAQLQQDVASCESNLAQAIKAGAYRSRVPVAALKEKRAGLEGDVATALASKDFDLCSALHLQLDAINLEIAHRDCVSLEAANDKLKAVTHEVETARTKKNFRKRSMMQLGADVDKKAQQTNRGRQLGHRDSGDEMAELNEDLIEFRAVVKTLTEEAKATEMATAKEEAEKKVREAKELAQEEARKVIEEKEKREEKARREEKERENAVIEARLREEKAKVDKEREDKENQERIKLEKEKAAKLKEEMKEKAEKMKEDARIEAERLSLIEIKVREIALAAVAEEARLKAEAEQQAEKVRQEEAAKNPYADMSYAQLTQVIDQNIIKVQQAVAAKNYKLCTSLEESLKAMQEARGKLPVPAALPTRAEVLVRITKIQAEIEDALIERKYKQCDELNAALVVLQEQLDAIPTAASVGKKVAELEAQLATLIANKTYADCEGIEIELLIAKRLHDRLLLEEPRLPTLTRSASQLQLTRPRRLSNGEPPISPMSSPVPKVKKLEAKKVTGNERPVSKLRPKTPITMLDTDTIFAVAEAMASRRADAALLIDSDGHLSGIITDNDITRRVVAQYIDPLTTLVEKVMTKDPKCVQEDDSALDALEMMVDNRFRHLPVMDKAGAVVGLLDIAKCLYDAISVLERVHDDADNNESEKNEKSAMNEAMMLAMKAAGGGSRRGSSKMQMEAMQALMESMFGGAVPTLRTIIGHDKIPRLLPTQTVRDASIMMALVRKGVLIMDSTDKLVGILTPKDLLTRVTAKGLNPDTVFLAEVMTPNPETVVPELTLLDALREMHDQKFLHLPVRDTNTGNIVGLVDVMELVCSTAGGEEGGKGWRDFFSGAMAASGDGESELSFNSSLVQSARGGKTISVRSRDDSKQGSKIISRKDDRPVSRLRPKTPITMLDTDTIFAVAEAMASRRADAALLIDSDGHLSGIITDNDITRRVVSQFIDPLTTCVDTVMTKNPKCVQENDSALDALEMMVDNRFRHLPVMDKSESVVGLLDIAKCLYDAISVLEKVDESDVISESSKNNSAAMNEAMMLAMKAAGGGSRRGSSKMQMEAMQALMESMFGGAVPTLRSIIGEDALPYVRPSANVREAAILMAEVRKGVLVMDAENELVGILTPKDLLSRVVAKGKSADLTAVSSVMTPNPECASADLTLLDALREMHDQKFLHLPVRDTDTGCVVGLVDVMELVCSTAGGEEGGKGWRDFFSGAMTAGGNGSVSDSESACSEGSRNKKGRRSIKSGEYEDTSDIYPIESNKQSRKPGYNHNFETGSTSYSAEFAFKITDSSGNVHRLKSSLESLHQLKIAVSEKLNVMSSALILKYIDDDKDEVVLSSDGSLRDAVDYARQAGMTALKLTASVTTLTSSPPRIPKRLFTDGKAEEIGTTDKNQVAEKSNSNVLILVAGGVAAALALGAFVFIRAKK